MVPYLSKYYKDFQFLLLRCLFNDFTLWHRIFIKLFNDTIVYETYTRKPTSQILQQQL